MKYLILLFVSLTFWACPEDPNEPDRILTYINNSNQPVIFNFIYSTLNDTSISAINFPLTIENTEGLKAEPSTSIQQKELIYRLLKKYPDNFLTLFIFNADTIAQVPWAKIVERESKLRVEQYNLEQLEALNWTITYP